MTAVASSPARRPLRRSADDKMVAGVCGGVAAWLGLDPPLVRLLTALSAGAMGLGLLVYVGLAVALPAPIDDDDEQRLGFARRAAIRSGLGLQLAGAALLLSAIGLAPDPITMLVSTLAAVGGGLLWRAATGDGPDPDAPRQRLAAITRVGLGLILLLVGAVLSLRPSGVGSVGIIVIVAAMVSGGAVLLFGPSLARARREARRERTERIRADERADVAARLHDSVLQTFAVIQHLDDASPRVQQLARSQERDLRAWLYAGEDAEGPETFAAAMRAAAREVEELHEGVAIDLVQPSDAPLTAGGQALVQAAREAMMNGARHSGTTQLSVLARVSAGELSIFIRDRGQGFDPRSVPGDRRGIRDSIVGRVRRAGGTATITSAPGEGTEVELVLPPGAGGSGS